MTFTEKMIAAAMFDVNVYEEVEKDTGATGQALLVVALAGMANGIGGMGMRGSRGLMVGIIAGVLGWLIWSGIIYLIGVKWFGHTSDMGELLRCLGFADSPGVLNLLGIIPGLGILVRFAVAIWLLMAFVVAVRQALDVETGRAVFVCFLGFLTYVFFVVIFLGSVVH